MTRKPSLWVLLATVIGIGITASLGAWQLDRADQKQDLHDTMMAREQLPMLDHTALPCSASDWQQAEQRHAWLRGHWLSGHTLYLSNRSMQGRAGFVVLTPLRLEPSPGVACAATVVLVQRGWVPRDLVDPARVPKIQDTAAGVRVPVRLVPPPSRMLELGSTQGSDTGPVRQNVTLSELSKEWGVILRPGSVQQLAAESPSAVKAPELLRQWWQPSADVGKHQAYAAQWFAMALIMGTLYAWFQWWRPRRGAAQ
ncbi:MAG TPA: SURF1 family protein [Aquabacterium sp.]|uniref:SURF1 family protein n=1 Tax=Aquabacterium sp. TaxID=1872578 RepID=UPI002E330F62|nr:SURF1 family protein [Aquabacterium sp.]HEX5372377.1 SURF1 family protein [Aquabacterium sp.]